MKIYITFIFFSFITSFVYGNKTDTSHFPIGRSFYGISSIPQPKGQAYIMYTLYGVGIFAVPVKNLQIGLFSSWIGNPALAYLKYTVSLHPSVNMGFGNMLGAFWYPGYGCTIPFLEFTFGSSKNNVTVSVGYLFGFGLDPIPELVLDVSEAREMKQTLVSIAVKKYVSPQVSIVFDSFIFTKSILKDKMLYFFSSFSLGVEVRGKKNRLNQYGITVLPVEGVAYPIPSVQFVRSF